MDEGSTGRQLVEGLDPEQREAVLTTAQPLRILAGAGSGKTRVLTRRIAHRVVHGDVDPRRVMALTFTRKAAGELTQRLGKLGLRELPTSGTFHAVAYAQLRLRWAGADRRPPALLDRKGSLLGRLVGRGGPLGPGELAAEIEWAKARLVSPERYVAEAERADRRPPVSHERIAELYGRYEAEKRQRHVVDFDDLLLRCQDALRDDPDFARAQRWRFRHLFVDEFQDVNPLQFGLLRAWLGARTDLCVVGDPNQAIYRWNGADASYLLDFERHFPGATTVALTTNYRCAEPILRLACATLGIRAAHAAREGGGKEATIRADADDVEEAAAVARAVRDHRPPGAPWRTQAVLVRTNAQASLIETALRRAGIPTRLRGATSLLEHFAVRHALRSAANSTEPLASWLADLDQAVHDLPETSEEDERRAALVELARLARELAIAEPSAPATSLPGWLTANLRGEDATPVGDAVEVATFHASKGLEWPVVHLAGIEEGFVPISRARTAEAVAEERRLLYVAMTRAQDELVLSWAAERTFGERTRQRVMSKWLADALQAVGRTEAPVVTGTPGQLAAARLALEEGGEDDAALSCARALRTWRSRRARGAGVPPAVILGDRALATLAAHRPTTVDELTASGALGPIAVSRYGEELLAVLTSGLGGN